MYIYLNEHSFCSQASSVSDAHSRMKVLYEVLQELKPLSKTIPITTSQILWQQEITSGYTTRNYTHDRDVDDARRVLFSIIITKGPFVEDLIDESTSSHECTLEASSTNLQRSSVAAACCFSGVLASLRDAPFFDTEIINVLFSKDGNPPKRNEVDNHFDPVRAKAYVEALLRLNVSSWKEFLDSCSTLFPHLLFCGEVEKHLQKIACTPFAIRNIMRHLEAMNNYMDKVISEGIGAPKYTEMGIDASRESGITLKHYGHLREFQCPDGKTRIFDWHSKQGNTRIHFYPPDSQVDNFLVGYIGAHLQNWSSN